MSVSCTRQRKITQNSPKSPTKGMRVAHGLPLMGSVLCSGPCAGTPAGGFGGVVQVVWSAPLSCIKAPGRRRLPVLCAPVVRCGAQRPCAHHPPGGPCACWQGRPAPSDHQPPPHEGGVHAGSTGGVGSSGSLSARPAARHRGRVSQQRASAQGTSAQRVVARAVNTPLSC